MTVTAAPPRREGGRLAEAASGARGKVITLAKAPFLHALGWSMGAYGVARITSLIVGMVLSSRLGTASFGQSTYFILSLTLVTAFSEMGMSSAITKFTVEGSGTQGKSPARIIAALHIAIPCWLIALGVVYFSTAVRHWELRTFAVFAATTLLFTWQIILAAILTGLGRQRAIFASNALFAVVQLAFAGFAVARDDIFIAYAGLGCAYAGQLVTMFIVAHRALGVALAEWFTPSPAAMRSVLAIVLRFVHLPPVWLPAAAMAGGAFSGLFAATFAYRRALSAHAT